LSEASAGLFDVTVAPALVRWGYLPKPPAGAGAGRAAARGCWQDVELLGGRAVRFRRPLCIDLGGIAKGFAVDLAVEALRDAGIPRGAVNAGGDLRLFGGEPERVHVRLPRFPGRWVGLTTLRDGALATSAGYFDDRRKPGAEVSPWVAPASGRARARRWSVSVKAHSCTWADGLTKVLMLAGRRALPVLRSFAAEGFIVTARGEVFSSEAADAA
jgi:thiamine biosynthesis lipoprotein